MGEVSFLQTATWREVLLGTNGLPFDSRLVFGTAVALCCARACLAGPNCGPYTWHLYDQDFLYVGTLILSHVDFDMHLCGNCNLVHTEESHAPNVRTRRRLGASLRALLN